MRLSGLMKGYLIWTVLVMLWLSASLALGWKMPAIAAGAAAFGTGSSRSSGGYFPHSSWSFGK